MEEVASTNDTTTVIGHADARRLDEIRKPGGYLRSAVVSRCRSVLRRRRVTAKGISFVTDLAFEPTDVEGQQSYSAWAVVDDTMTYTDFWAVVDGAKISTVFITGGTGDFEGITGTGVFIDEGEVDSYEFVLKDSYEFVLTAPVGR
jgi:hypothetical protein